MHIEFKMQEIFSGGGASIINKQVRQHELFIQFAKQAALACNILAMVKKEKNVTKTRKACLIFLLKLLYYLATDVKYIRLLQEAKTLVAVHITIQGKGEKD